MCMSDRRIDAFFYGLFMDIDILREADVAPINPRRAYVDDFALRIGQRATLLPSAGGRAYGVLFFSPSPTLNSNGSTPLRAWNSTAPKLYSPSSWMAHARRLCVTTCVKRRDHTSGIRNMLRVFSVP